LDDLIREELGHAERQLAAQGFQLGAAWQNDEFIRRLGRYESVFEGLAKVFAVLGRWGTTAEFAAAEAVLSSLSDQEITSGNTGYLALRFYPLVLLTYAYGLGLFKAGQFERLNSLFRLPLKDRNRNGRPLISHYFLDAWEELENSAWTILPEFNNQARRKALSDHLHTILLEWIGTELFLSNEFTVAFEEFELLGSLTFLSVNYGQQDLDNAIADQAGLHQVWAPIGRIAWDGAVARSILTKWANAEQRKRLLDAGFTAGSAEYWDKAIVYLNRTMHRGRLW
jgi:hypothetical protein